MEDLPDITRRTFVKATSMSALLPFQSGSEAEPARGRTPVGFVSHGAPTLALDAERGRGLRDWAAALPRPKALLVVSGHWERSPVAVGTVRPERLVYDFGGFDRRLYELEYAAPGAPELADRVVALLDGPARADERMWDHGVWIPLLHMYPEADVPLLQLSLPSRSKTSDLLEVGRRLSVLRDEGVLILASGGMVHNLGQIDWSERAPPERWATAFEDWAKETLRSHDVDAWLDLEARAPDLERAHPTLEHILPMIVAFGAATEADAVSFPVEGFEYGSLSRTAVQFG